ncbi:dead deah box rna [Plasmopara halstedii]|uniref:Dead deah box rna n=1 Tax=Plasmopara halstedii TaxID=4781 RepID=A0A0N7L6A4_PLAHL|nr:dead deah box rna [Plasmopara halstedii]CEG43723.1 dead deah box rna [Plasmopara halstedii]|eukprot:XP_024580092.1 dead deah box rna [Plasmopara halstedii]
MEVPLAKKMKSENATHVGGEENPSLDSFRICDETKKNLKARGIHTLFPIQAMTFDKIMDGNDIMGRARTGMGKTLAFALPVIELLLKDKRPRARGRAPRVICMAPTRELAKQVASEFELTGPSLSTVCIYGGASYQSQNNAFRSGVDILVGTTGRVIDHIDRGNLRLHNCEFLILDEADTMLEMGFREDVQKVFTAMEMVQNERTGKRQMLLFSATIPRWVKDVADKYMKKAEYVNLVKDSDDQASTDVQHIAIPCHWQGRPTLLANLLGVYAKKDSRTIIFAETKKDCNELAVHPEIKTECQVLHGDIAQEQRETTMKAFREGQGLIYSFPVKCTGNGVYEVINGLPISSRVAAMMKATAEELLEEKADATEILGRHMTSSQQAESRLVWEVAVEGAESMSAKQLTMCLRALGFHITKLEAQALVYEFDFMNSSTIELGDFQKIFLAKTLESSERDKFEQAFSALAGESASMISMNQLEAASNIIHTNCNIDKRCFDNNLLDINVIRHQMALQDFDKDNEAVKLFLDATASSVSKEALAAFLRLQ